MYQDPNKPNLTKEDSLAMTVNSFSLGFFVTFLIWLAMHWTTIEQVATVETYRDEILTGCEHAWAGGILAVIWMWLYETFLAN